MANELQIDLEYERDGVYEEWFAVGRSWTSIGLQKRITLTQLEVQTTGTHTDADSGLAMYIRPDGIQKTSFVSG